MTLPCPRGLAYLPYQAEGISRMRTMREALLADEMGLGKTIQAIGWINCHPEVERVLVVCPASLILNWRRELDRWLIDPTVEVDIISYDSLPRLDLSRSWDLVVFDESHYIKTASARRSRLARGIRAGARLLLTGTPILNRPIELWHQLHVMLPKRFPLSSMVSFGVRFCAGHRVRKATNRGWRTEWDFTGASNLDALARGLAPLMVRRFKRDVLRDLPAKRRQVIEIPSDGFDRGLVRDLADAATRLEAWLADSDFPGLPDDEAEHISVLRHRVGLAKAPHVAEFVRNALESERKIVVFAHHIDVIEAIADDLVTGWAAITGSTSLRERQSIVDRFQDPASGLRVVIGQIQAAGVGITLTVSSHVVFAELAWSPGIMTQAEDRCHRIGQTNSVLVQHLVLEESLDYIMASTLVRKQNLIDAALGVPKN